MQLRKKGEEDNFVLELSIFIILNLVFFGVLLFFVSSSGRSSAVYEEVYAKQIALFIDRAKPGTIMQMDIAELVRNNNANKDPVSVEDGRVRVSLRNSGGYSYKYFTSYKVSGKINEGYLILQVEK